MKKCTIALAILLSLNAKAQKYSTVEYQPLAEPAKGQVLNMTPIEVSYDMTTHLIFPSEISYVDLGSPDIISEKAENIGNVLKVKAQRKSFVKTNMTVITSDGKYFAFMVYYAASPTALNIKLSGSDYSSVAPKIQSGNYNKSASYAMFDNTIINEGEAAHIGSEILSKKRRLYHLGLEKYDMQVGVKNVFIKDNLIFLDFFINNKTSVPYEIELVKFYIKDAEQMKKTAQQELEAAPVNQFNPSGSRVVPGKGTLSIVYSFQRFTIPDKKVFTVEVLEKNGGRKFLFNLTNQDIIKATKI